MKPSKTAGLVLVLAVSCAPEKPLKVPDLEEVVSVGAFYIEGPDVLWKHEITDPGRIDELLTHFRKHNTGFRVDTRLHEWIHGPRDHEYCLLFKGKKDSPLMVWIGPDWVGGMDLRMGEPWTTRYRWLSPEERRDLLALIAAPHGRGAG